ncbi:MAG: dienelactone hydrolase family protein [Coleofasciculaceae cyanobacterium]
MDGEKNFLTPMYPLDIASDLTVPILGLYGGKDDLIPTETVEKMREALATGESGSKIIVYRDAPHGFFADYRPSYREEAAEDGWQRLQAWFKEYGVV